MLHITSWMQGLSKNKVKEIKLYQHDFLRDVKKPQSYIYDNYMNKYDEYHYHYDVEDFASVGYWGCVRDRNADIIHRGGRSKPQELSDVFWGQFEDQLHSSESAMSDDRLGLPVKSDSLGGDGSESPAPIASPVPEASGLTGANSTNNRNYLYDFKSSKLKIQAIKRDESKILIQKLQEIEAGFNKEPVKLFDINMTNGATVSSVSPSNILRANLAILSQNTSEANAHKLINLVHFGNQMTNTSSSTVDSIKLQNLKNMLDVLTKLNKSINVFVGDLALPSDNPTCADSEGAKCESIFSSMNIHACMNGVNDLYKSYCLDKSLSDREGKISENDDDDDEDVHNHSRSSNSPTESPQKTSQDMKNLLLNRKMNTVYLCSNIYERVRQVSDGKSTSVGAQDGNNFKSFGFGNHSTMILECNNVKIGFMALVDEQVCRKLLKKVYSKKQCDDDEKHYRDLLRTKIEYSDFLNEAKRLSEQLRLCGANLVVALANMDNEDDLNRLINEASDIDLVLSNTTDQSRPNELKFSKLASTNDQQPSHRWFIQGASSFDCLSLISLKVDPKNANKIVDISITKYNAN